MGESFLRSPFNLCQLLRATFLYYIISDIVSTSLCVYKFNNFILVNTVVGWGYTPTKTDQKWTVLTASFLPSRS